MEENRKQLIVAAAFATVLLLPTVVSAQPVQTNAVRHHLTLLSVNMDLYQPIEKDQRFYQSREGAFSRAPNRAIYHTPAELYDDLEVKLDHLDETISELNPDIIMLQRVAASTKDMLDTPSCRDFYQRQQNETPHEATVWRLSRRLSQLHYKVAASCSGKISLKTTPDQFHYLRIVTQRKQGLNIVIDFDDPGFSDYRLIEGFAILVRQPWRIERNQLVAVSYTASGKTLPVQLTVVRAPRIFGSKWFVVVNIETGHKVRHFEQSVALRQLIDQYVAMLPEPELFGGLIVGGLMQAKLLRPHPHSFAEVSMIPWEVYISGQFDFRLSSHPARDISSYLNSELEIINSHQFYKPWANILPAQVASGRIRDAVARFLLWQDQRSPHILAKSLTATVVEDTFSSSQRQDGQSVDQNSRFRRARHARYTPAGKQLFFSPNLELKNSKALPLCLSPHSSTEDSCHAILAKWQWEIP